METVTMTDSIRVQSRTMTMMALVGVRDNRGRVIGLRSVALEPLEV